MTGDSFSQLEPLPPFDPNDESWKNKTDDEKNLFMLERTRIRLRRMMKLAEILIMAAKEEPDNKVLQQAASDMFEEIQDLQRRVEKPPLGL